VNVLFSVRHRGAAGTASRAGMILSRFGPTPARMVRSLEQYVAVTDKFGVSPTLPITARVLARHARTIRSFVDRGVEFAVHGLVHDDHAVRGFEDQRETIRVAMAIFDAEAVPHSGFRAPYLRYNTATERALRQLRVSYHSSQAIAFPVVTTDHTNGRSAAYRRVLELYGALDAERAVARPRIVDDLVHIPVVLPDDESLIERLGLDAEARTEIWTAILHLTHQRADLFTVQLHPERLFEFADTLEHVLGEARRLQPAVWIARLDEIAAWWRRRAHSMLRVETIGAERHRVSLDADSDATLLVRGVAPGDATSWDGRTLVARSRVFEVAGSRKPAVGVSLRTPEAVITFLQEEGLPCERSNERDSYGAYVDLSDEWDERRVLAAIDECAGPLVRLSRWPRAARSALAVTGDIDSVTLQDFVWRVWETRGPKDRRGESGSHDGV